MSQDREPLPSRAEGLPPLPPEARLSLDQGLVALRLADLSQPVQTALVDHLRLLLAWNQAINLSAIRSAGDAVREHILDSLSAVHLLRERGLEALLDLGSGGGYPGLPLALALPARRTLLVESVAKKAGFLSAAAAMVASDGPPGLGEVEVFNGRAEALAADARHRERWPAVVARAIAPLAELAELALPLVAHGGVLIAWKRRPFEVELAAADGALDVLGGGRPLIVPIALAGLEDHILVVVEKIGPTPAGYPREPALRRRQPLASGERLPSP